MIRHEAAKVLKACSNMFQAFSQDLKRKTQAYTSMVMIFPGRTLEKSCVRSSLYLLTLIILRRPIIRNLRIGSQHSGTPISPRHSLGLLLREAMKVRGHCEGLQEEFTQEPRKVKVGR